MKGRQKMRPSCHFGVVGKDFKKNHIGHTCGFLAVFMSMVMAACAAMISNNQAAIGRPALMERNVHASSMRTIDRPASAALGENRAQGLMGNTPEGAFYVYKDADSPENHYRPTGYMGDCGDIHMNEAWNQKPQSGETCIRLQYDAKGKAPSVCDYNPPCRWAGVYWQEPPNNWGKDEVNKGRGFDLSGYRRLTFWARADKQCQVQFKVGGIDAKYGDSLRQARQKTTKLTQDWSPFTIDLEGAKLSHIIGGFCWVANQDANPEGIVLYLDEIRFEK
jgi:hypothetical protein